MKVTRRRTIWALALLAGAAGVWIAGAKLSRGLLLSGLNAEIASDDTDRALIAVAQLEKLDIRGVPGLVAAANHSDERVATSAREAIARLLATWSRQNEATLATTQYERRLTKLAVALDEANFSNPSPAAADWANRTAERLLQLADRIPPGYRVALILRCEAVLDRTAGYHPAAPLAPIDPPELASVPSEPVEITTAPNVLRIRPSTPAKVETASTPTVAASQLKVVEAVETLPRSITKPIAEPWQPNWNNPEVAPPVDTVLSIPEANQPQFQLADASDRALLAIWLLHSALPVGDSLPREMISLTHRIELAARGYRDLRDGIVLAVLSNRPHDRTKLVNQLLTSSVGDASNWLLLLARDDSPQVRRAAISALLTCRDRRILKVIHDLALHDNDPQVAALAPQIGKLLR